MIDSMGAGGSEYVPRWQVGGFSLQARPAWSGSDVSVPSFGMLQDLVPGPVKIWKRVDRVLMGTDSRRQRHATTAVSFATPSDAILA